MKLSLFFTLSFSASCFFPLGLSAQSISGGVSAVSDSVVMQEGVFWAKHEAAGKIYSGGNWIDPVFDVTDQAAIDAAIASLPALKASNIFEYTEVVDSLGVAASLDGSNAAAIRLVLGMELAAAISSEDSVLLGSPDWTQADLSEALAANDFLLLGKDLSMVKGWSIKDLDGILDGALHGTILPVMDLTGWLPTGAMLQGVDLTNVRGLTPATFAGVDSFLGLYQTILPAMDLTGFTPTGDMVQSADLSRTTGLTVAALSQVGTHGLMGTILPAMDLTGFTPVGDMIRSADLSRTTGLTVAAFAGLDVVDGLQGTILPVMDLTGFVPTQYMISGADLSRTTGLSVAALESVNSSGLQGTILPAMDLSGWTPTGQRIRGADLSLTTGLTVNSLSSVDNIFGLFETTLPAMDLSTWAPTGYLLYTDISRATGVTPATLLGLTSLEGTRLPSGITAQQLLNAGLTSEQISGAIYTP